MKREYISGCYVDTNEISPRLHCSTRRKHLESLEVLFSYLQQRYISALVGVHTPDDVVPPLCQLRQGDLHLFLFNRLSKCDRVMDKLRFGTFDR